MIFINRVILRSSKRISNPYGKKHTGVDLKSGSTLEENQVYAHSNGKVVVVVDGKDKKIGSTGLASYGNYIEIDHGNGNRTRYAHLLKHSIRVQVGQVVNKDTVIGVIGESGNAYGRHLHFEVFYHGKRTNPEPYLTHDFIPLSDNGISYQTHDKRYGWNPNVFAHSGNYAGNFGIPMDAILMDQYRVRVHDMVKKQWLPWVQNRNDYAGNFGNAIDGVQIDGDMKYRVHLKDGTWLAWVQGYGSSSNGYAGIYGKAIDAIEIGM